MLNKANVEKDAMTRYLYSSNRVRYVSSQGVRNRGIQVLFSETPLTHIGMMVYDHIDMVQLYTYDGMGV